MAGVENNLINSKSYVVENSEDNLSKERLFNAPVNQGGGKKYARLIREKEFEFKGLEQEKEEIDRQQRL